MSVELVRVVENCRFGGSRGMPVVVARDFVEELGEDGRVEVARTSLDHPESEVDVSEEPALLGLTKRRPGSELVSTAHVVEERRGEQEIVPEARMKLRSLATQGRDADRVLEQPSRVAVMAVGTNRGERPQSAPNLRVADE